MALPIVKNLKDCVDFSKTVEPYIPQFLALPQRAFLVFTGSADLQTLYVSTNPLIAAFALSLLFSLFFFIITESNKNYSQVDRAWSVIPTFYNAHFTLYAHLMGLPTQRLDLMLACSIIWSIRLTFNYWRKGGYSVGSEDYRWATVAKYVGPIAMFIFDIAFIAIIQNILLLSITVPSYTTMLASRIAPASLSSADWAFAALLVGLVGLAATADQEQWEYYAARNSYRATAQVSSAYYQQADLDLGFNKRGLWAYSRHPNFLAEQAFWLTFYLWSCYTTGTTLSWTAIGAAGYLALFQASTWLTELLTSRKYPEYREYQARVGRFFPKLVSGPSRDLSDLKASPAVETEKKKK